MEQKLETGVMTTTIVTTTMAPRTAASVCWCAMFCLVLLVNSVFCLKTGSFFTREMLMNIRVITPENLLPTFIASSVDILDILVKGALTFVHTVKRRRRGKRAGASPPAGTSHTAARNIPLQRAFTG